MVVWYAPSPMWKNVKTLEPRTLDRDTIIPTVPYHSIQLRTTNFFCVVWIVRLQFELLVATVAI